LLFSNRYLFHSFANFSAFVSANVTKKQRVYTKADAFPSFSMANEPSRQKRASDTIVNMTTSFAYHPAPVISSHFDYSTNDSYPDYLAATTDSYPTSTIYGDAFTASLTGDPLAISAFADVSAAPEQAFFAPATASDLAYSPARSHGENLLMPQLSESGASINSSSTSALASPQLPPQYPMDAWSAGQMLDARDATSHPDLLFTAATSTVDHEVNKMSFVGESPSTSPLQSSSCAPLFSNSFIASPLAQSARFSWPQPSSLLAPFEASPARRMSASEFRAPGLPASVLNSMGSSPLSSPGMVDARRSSLPGGLPSSTAALQNTFDARNATSHSPVSLVRSSHRYLSNSPTSESFPWLSRPHHGDESTRTNTSPADPTVLNPYSPMFAYPEVNMPPTPYGFEHVASPAPSNPSLGGKIKSPPRSPFHIPTTTSYPYPSGRRQSNSSSLSHHSSHRSTSYDVEEMDKADKGVCPYPECGKSFKDIKTHMLTHQNERPEKCPIQSCEYHVKGFARKYDKNRHTLTHYKGTMVCGFCPGSGSSAEKSFNRADVFKRHLMSVHNVEQVPPNSRKKSPSTKKRAIVDASNEASGTCSTCSVRFANAQDFYEHLDDCVLRVVQQIEPSEEINQMHLGVINDDEDVKSTLEKHNLPSSVDDLQVPDLQDDDEEDESGDNEDRDGERDPRSGKGSIRTASGRLSNGVTLGASRIAKPGSRVGPRPGLTYSKGGVRLSAPAAATAAAATTNGRKKRKNNPASWGCSIDKMNMKKRVVCCYDGQRRLAKDDMMLDRTFEVRVPLHDSESNLSMMDGLPVTSGGTGSYITDLDYQTLKRADGIFSATEEERGPWVADNIYETIVDFGDDMA
jgi:hypothetical protein